MGRIRPGYAGGAVATPGRSAAYRVPEAALQYQNVPQKPLCWSGVMVWAASTICSMAAIAAS